MLDDTFERQQGLSQHALYAAQQLLMLVRPPAHCMQPAAACVLRLCSTRCGKAAKEPLEACAGAAPITAAAPLPLPPRLLLQTFAAGGLAHIVQGVAELFEALTDGEFVDPSLFRQVAQASIG